MSSLAGGDIMAWNVLLCKRGIYSFLPIDSYTVSVYNRSMKHQGEKLTIEDLAARVKLSVRTIRFYITEGLIPGPEGRGTATTYSEEHLLKLRLVRRLSDQRVPLSQIKTQMDGLTLGEIESLLRGQEEQQARLVQAAQESSPRAYVAALLDRAQSLKEAPSSQPSSPSSPSRKHSFPSAQAPVPPASEVWQRWELAPGVELHVRGDAERRHKSLIDALLRAANKPPSAEA